MSAYTNAMAFRRLSAVGNSARARIYMRRAHEAAVRMGDEFGRYSAMLLPAQEALLYRDVVRSKQIVDDVRQRWTSARLRPLNDDVVGQKLVSLYADLGRFADARAVMTERPTTTHGSFDWFLMIFGFLDARESLRAFVDSHYPRVSKGPPTRSGCTTRTCSTSSTTWSSFERSPTGSGMVGARPWKARGELAKAAAVLQLADASQALGSENTAEKIDAELLQLLSIADDDHPVIARVKARQAAR